MHEVGNAELIVIEVAESTVTTVGQPVPVQPQAIKVSPGMTDSVRQFVPAVHVPLVVTVVDPDVHVICGVPEGGDTAVLPSETWSAVSCSFWAQT